MQVIDIFVKSVGFKTQIPQLYLKKDNIIQAHPHFLGRTYVSFLQLNNLHTND